MEAPNDIPEDRKWCYANRYKETDREFILYMAILISKLSDFKYTVYSSKEVPDELKLNAPCSYDHMSVFTEALKRFAPDLYRHDRSFNDTVSLVEKELFGKKKAEAGR